MIKVSTSILGAVMLLAVQIGCSNRTREAALPEEKDMSVLTEEESDTPQRAKKALPDSVSAQKESPGTPPRVNKLLPDAVPAQIEADILELRRLLQKGK